MRGWVLAAALMAMAGGAQAADGDDKPDVPADWLKKPTYEQLKAVWPREAMRRGVNGGAVISCVVTVVGMLEACKVVEEKPAGAGFGASALLLAPSFVMKPALKDGKPVSSTVRIPIAFGMETRLDQIDLVTTPMVERAVWEAAPNFTDMAAAWPKAAGDAPFGHVSMRCRLRVDGGLRNCDLLTETPKGKGFWLAARDVLAPKFRMRMTPGEAETLSKAYVNVPVRFLNPSTPEGQTRTITKPFWITGPDPAKVIAVYPEQAAAQGVTTGRGVASCAVAPEGRLVDCKLADATPEGLGFSEAAVVIASAMKMNPWSDGGGPVDGARLRLPIVFNLAPAAP